MSKRTSSTDPLIRSWLQIRIANYAPRIKKRRTTKAAPYEFSLPELVFDLTTTLNELKERVRQKDLYKGARVDEREDADRFD